jgi:hypothetical protein
MKGIPPNKLSKYSRGNDTIVAHITPKEALLLKSMGGSGTINPKTGLLEFWDSDQGRGGVGDDPAAGDYGGWGDVGSEVSGEGESTSSGFGISEDSIDFLADNPLYGEDPSDIVSGIGIPANETPSDFSYTGPVSYTEASVSDGFNVSQTPPSNAIIEEGNKTYLNITPDKAQVNDTSWVDDAWNSLTSMTSGDVANAVRDFTGKSLLKIAGRAALTTAGITGGLGTLVGIPMGFAMNYAWNKLLKPNLSTEIPVLAEDVTTPDSGGSSTGDTDVASGAFGDIDSTDIASLVTTIDPSMRGQRGPDYSQYRSLTGFKTKYGIPVT